ncbi:MAG: PDZ domain-containing protein [Gemmatimonadetes bacterium]|nr:PDZ domain-containing protein [Gemmatimonadota bacterium]MBI3569158.1 PDZ domain-containing protein [Gemmatimonadota bacterium]
MRILSIATLMVAAAPAAWAQTRTPAPRAPRTFVYSTSRDDADRPMLGVTTSAGDKRDTLGLLVVGVTTGSPAEKAGIEEGNRLVAIDGVSLKVAREDAGDPEMANAMSNRLRREVGKHKAGEEVSLEVYAGGRTKTLKAKLATSNDIEHWSNADDEERAALGVSLTISGSKRDTAGIFISGISDGGPADKAGIAEGDRIASINGVDLRVPKEDAGDASVSSARFQRLQRELRKVKPGQAVDLVVVSGGTSRTVKATTVKSSDLRDGGGVRIRIGDGMGLQRMRMFDGHVPEPPPPPDAPLPPRVRFFRNDGPDGLSFDFDGIGPEVRRQIEIEVPRAMDRVREQMDALKLELPALRSRIIRKVVI